MELEKDDLAFRTMCEKVGIKFTIYGIDQLAQDLFLKYRSIAKEYLNLAIDSNQIETLEDFIKHYDASKLAAPLSTQFMFREDTLESLGNLFRNTDIVILTGPAGTGKTRLALQYAKSYAQTINAHLFCIHDNALPIYNDLSLYLEKPGHSYEIGNGLAIAFHAFSGKGKCVAAAVQHYLKSNTPFNINPIPILRDLFLVLEPFEILSLFETEDFDEKNTWLYAYYHELPIDKIDEMQVDGLYSFLRSTSDATLTQAHLIESLREQIRNEEIDDILNN